MTDLPENIESELHDSIRQQSYLDLVQRSMPGVISYPLVWLVIALPRLFFDFAHQNLVWMLSITLLVPLVAGLRVLLLKHFRGRLGKGSVRSDWELTLGMVLCAGFWGLMSACSLMPTPLQPHVTIIMASTFGLCAGGSISLAISARIVFLFLGCMLLPSIVVISMGYSEQPLELAGMMLIFWAGMYLITRLPRQEYFAALSSTLKLERQAAYLNELTLIDSLTGLKNRRYFDPLLETEVKRATRNQYWLSLLLVDLDHFKLVNDQYGHLAGDECLKQVSVTLQNQLRRATDVAARFGGEEFAVLLPGTGDEDARMLAEHIREAIAAIRLPAPFETIRLTASVGGVALVPHLGDEPRSFLQWADEALYKAKAEGRNRVRFSNAAQSVEAPRAPSLS